MLYQTPYPLLFQFHPLPSSTLPLATTSPISSVPLFSYLPQAETEMECVEAAALKTSFRKDLTAVKFSPQTFMEELSALNVPNAASCDDFSVDDLLDFSHVVEDEEKEEQQQHKEEEDTACVSIQQANQSHQICNHGTSYSVKDDYNSLPTSELSVPAEDAADLEWLSHFVEDSFSEFSAVFTTVTLTEKPKCLVAKEPEPGSNVPNQPCFKTPVQTKARSKRTRTGVRVWPLGSPLFTESSSSSTTTSSSSSSSSPSSPLLIYTNLAQSLEQVCSEVRPSAKKPKKRASSDGAAAQTPRRCSHCGVQKTPQWRTGPLGAKTLCNACGVRYKSGRLLPEYRPACSPTFSSELHSNHHRKVLEMRRKREIVGGVETDVAPAAIVPSF
ncbi:GATA transcription factor 5-like [Gastrolobium bilobum]|uniref:GATA transcription factor 5-like n=1 Tax=Gastrolobium bilobum TaxID=150636 RepID=UPI002AB1E274|nr:GATA transcription factor 5-like [Gastrolobium bilobum]